MGWETTRIIRLYPKCDAINIDIVEFCQNIAKTATGLTTHVLWSNNKIENCYDVKFESSKSAGELKFNKNEIEVWEIKSFDYGETIICFHNQENNFTNSVLFKKAEFFFDEIKLEGVKNGVDSFLEIANLRNLWKQGCIKVSGKYNAGNHYQTVPLSNESKVRVAEVDLSELLMLRGNYCRIDNFVKNKKLKTDLADFIEFVNGDIYENYFPGLDEIKFYYKNRCVKKIKWMPLNDYEQGAWVHSSSDWWDNCANTHWLENQKKKTKKNKA